MPLGIPLRQEFRQTPLYGIVFRKARQVVEILTIVHLVVELLSSVLVANVAPVGRANGMILVSMRRDRRPTRLRSGILDKRDKAFTV